MCINIYTDAHLTPDFKRKLIFPEETFFGSILGVMV